MGGLFDVSSLTQEKEKLLKEVEKEDFWTNSSQANKTYQHLKNITKTIDKYNNLLEEVELFKELLSSEELPTEEIERLKKEVEELEIATLLNGEYDINNCYLEIHPGAGGTESCDWAQMLERMYERFMDKNGYKYTTIDRQDGEEAGIKSVIIHVEGEYAYGYLKSERGVHRLVRISPFDANRRRHTSFASVSVIPEYDKTMNIEIKEEDLKIDVYHSSGAGGQSVNTSNSAVRITHLPTKTVVTCQQERSQLRNKEVALELLKNKLYQQKLAEEDKKIKAITGEVQNIDFGSQIRSYVLEPYKLVKDNRSKYESNDPLKILDGDILEMLEANLKTK